MDIAVISLIVACVSSFAMGIVGVLSKVRKCKSFCCSMNCKEKDEEIQENPTNNQLFHIQGHPIRPDLEISPSPLRISSPTINNPSPNPRRRLPNIPLNGISSSPRNSPTRTT